MPIRICAMVDPRVLEELMTRIAAALPPEMGRLRDDVNRNLRAAVTSALARMDIVTREEFDVQAAVLARTREKLDTLDKQVASLEKKLIKRPKRPGTRKKKPPAEEGG